MTKRERLERMLKLREARVDAVRGALGQAQARVDDAAETLRRTQVRLARTEELQREASAPGGHVDLGRVLALEEGVLGVRQQVRRSEAQLQVSERRRDEVGKQLEAVARQARGSEKALQRCSAEEARAERRRTWNELIAFSLRAGGREEAA